MFAPSGNSPITITSLQTSELRQYFLHIKNVKKYSRASSTIAICGIKTFYEKTLKPLIRVQASFESRLSSTSSYGAASLLREVTTSHAALKDSPKATDHSNSCRQNPKRPH